MKAIAVGRIGVGVFVVGLVASVAAYAHGDPPATAVRAGAINTAPTSNAEMRALTAQPTPTALAQGQTTFGSLTFAGTAVTMKTDANFSSDSVIFNITSQNAKVTAANTPPKEHSPYVVQLMLKGASTKPFLLSTLQHCIEKQTDQHTYTIFLRFKTPIPFDVNRKPFSGVVDVTNLNSIQCVSN